MTFEDCCAELVKRGYLKLEPRLPEGEPTLVFTSAGEMAAVELLQLESRMIRQMATLVNAHLSGTGG